MVKLSINLEKRSAVFFGALIFFMGLFFVLAYGTNDPKVLGHSGGEVMVNINGNEMTLKDAIDGGKLGAKVVSGEEIYLGSFNMTENHYRIADIPFNINSSIDKIRIEVIGPIRSGISMPCGPGTNLVLEKKNGFKAACEGSKLINYKWNGCNNVADWMSFDAYNANGKNDGDMTGGVKVVKWALCDFSGGAGGAQIKVYATPRAVMIGSSKISGSLPKLKDSSVWP